MKDFRYWVNKKIMTGTIDSAMMAFTAPVISLQAVRSISNQMYSLAEILSILIGAYMLHLVSGELNKERLIRHGGKMIIVDYVFWLALSAFSYTHMELRYFAMVVLMPIFYDTKKVMMKIVINRNLSGDELSNISIRDDKLCSLSAAIGFGASLVCMELDSTISLGAALLVTRLTVIPSTYMNYKVWETGSKSA